MPTPDKGRIAFGGPGSKPHWTPGDKDGVGTAFGNASTVWFTIWRGVLSEIYYPTVDRPQMSELSFLISNGNFVHTEINLSYQVERITNSQGYTVRRTAPADQYTLEKQIVCDPDQPCVVQHTRFSGDLTNLKCYGGVHPQLQGAGLHNNAQTLYSGDRQLLAANVDDRWLVFGADPGFDRTSCGYIGQSDGFTDVDLHRRMEWQFDKADDGNVFLTGEIDIAKCPEFTMVIAFGETLHSALTSALHSLSVPFTELRESFIEGWSAARSSRSYIGRTIDAHDALFDCSCNVLTTHKDKTYLGAMIASLAIPFGEARTDPEGKGGYHLVWPRDMVNCATALLAAGDERTPLQSLIYLAVAQRQDGAFAQNFWMNGEPCWSGLQLDEVTYPILLAYQLRRHECLGAFNPLRMVLKAAEYIVNQGPITPQERWEQVSGYSPSTFGIVIAALICAASFAREAGQCAAADFLTDYADYLYLHLNDWTVTDRGDLHPDIRRYFVRINPAKPGDGNQHSPDDAILKIPDHPSDAQSEFPARNIVDAGFLELVRYGILPPDDDLIADSLRVVDHVLKVETPCGPCWRRFNHDGYGQRDDGSPFNKWGKGRAWPLLTGERGHYELSAGRDATFYLQTMERLATPTGLLAEQVWDCRKEIDGRQMSGRPTESAVPLAWAHAEYIKLALSIKKGVVVDLIPEVAERYLGSRRPRTAPEIWTLNYPANSMRAGRTLRVHNRRPFRLRYSLDNWTTIIDRDAQDTGIAVNYTDIDVPAHQETPVRFTFLWQDNSSWQGCDYSVEVRHS